MKNSEESVERVLKGLRACAPPAGMERRVLAEVRARAACGERSDWRPGWAWSLVVGVGVAVLLAVGVGRSRQSPVGLRQESARLVRSLPAPTIGEAEVLVHQQQRRVQLKEHTNGRGARVVRASTSLAEREMLAPSRPAPPLPLTHEERLLLRVVRTSDPAQLAMLNQEVRERREVESKAEFRRFFGLAGTGENE